MASAVVCASCGEPIAPTDPVFYAGAERRLFHLACRRRLEQQRVPAPLARADERPRAANE
jgi:hypothetical protein